MGGGGRWWAAGGVAGATGAAAAPAGGWPCCMACPAGCLRLLGGAAGVGTPASLSAAGAWPPAARTGAALAARQRRGGTPPTPTPAARTAPRAHQDEVRVGVPEPGDRAVRERLEPQQPLVRGLHIPASGCRGRGAVGGRRRARACGRRRRRLRSGALISARATWPRHASPLTGRGACPRAPPCPLCWKASSCGSAGGPRRPARGGREGRVSMGPLRPPARCVPRAAGSALGAASIGMPRRAAAAAPSAAGRAAADLLYLVPQAGRAVLLHGDDEAASELLVHGCGRGGPQPANPRSLRERGVSLAAGAVATS